MTGEGLQALDHISAYFPRASYDVDFLIYLDYFQGDRGRDRMACMSIAVGKSA